MSSTNENQIIINLKEKIEYLTENGNRLLDAANGWQEEALRLRSIDIQQRVDNNIFEKQAQQINSLEIACVKYRDLLDNIRTLLLQSI